MSEKELTPDGNIALAIKQKEQPFFFSGGYSNRDYLPLIESFKTLSYNLIIICASMNTEIVEDKMPSNIKVFRDLPSETFEAYVQASIACIIPIAHDTGAAGQSCLLRYMQNGKIIIATDTAIIREYIDNTISGVLVSNNREAMASAICAVASNPGLYLQFAETAKERYHSHFSREAIAHCLDSLVL